MWNILEQPWTLLVIAVIAFLILTILRNSLPDKYRFISWFIPVLIAVFSFAFDYLVNTDTEQIKKLIKTAVNAVENEQPNEIDALIADDYRDSLHKNKTEIMKKCRSYLRRPFADRIIYSIPELEIEDGQAELLITNRIFFEEGSEYIQAQGISTQFKIYLTKGNSKEWLINKVELSSLNNQPQTWSNVKKLESWF